MLVLVPGLLPNLPQPTLAAVVIAASLSLADIPGTVRLWHQRRTEFLLSMAAFLGVALLGVLEGIAIAVALSILNVFRRAWWPYQTILGRVPRARRPTTTVSSYPDAERLPGLRDLPLRRAAVLRQRANVPRPDPARSRPADPRPRWIIIAAEPITDVDTTAADMLVDLDEELNAARHHPRVRRAEGPGARQDRALRADRAARPRPLLPHPARRRSTPTASRPAPTGSSVVQWSDEARAR